MKLNSHAPRITRLALLLALSSPLAVLAQNAADPHAGHHATATATPAATAASAPAPAASAPADAQVLTQGEVRKIDLSTGKITLRHQAIVNLDMPPMTMVFRAQPPQLLDGLKVGDMVRFHAETPNGSYVVTRIDKAAP